MAIQDRREVEDYRMENEITKDEKKRKEKKRREEKRSCYSIQYLNIHVNFDIGFV